MKERTKKIVKMTGKLLLSGIVLFYLYFKMTPEVFILTLIGGVISGIICRIFVFFVSVFRTSKCERYEEEKGFLLTLYIKGRYSSPHILVDKLIGHEDKDGYSICGYIATTCEKGFSKKYIKRHKKKLIDECIMTYSMEE